jgi:nitroreductase
MILRSCLEKFSWLRMLVIIMENYLSQLVNAVNTRHSCRNFLLKDLIPEEYEKIVNFLKHLTVPFTHQVDISFHLVPEGQSIVHFKGPRRFATLLALPSILEQAKLGFLGELLILFCESIHLGTCWIGHYNKESINQIIHSSSIERGLKIIYCIILVGFASYKRSLVNAISRSIFSRKCKDVDTLLHKEAIKDFPRGIRNALDLACKAPSAMNSQKWYYLVRENQSNLSIELSKPPGYHHFKWQYYDIDVGTAAAHIWLGLLKENYQVKVKLENRDENAVWTFETSI